MVSARRQFQKASNHSPLQSCQSAHTPLRISGGVFWRKAVHRTASATRFQFLLAGASKEGYRQDMADEMGDTAELPKADWPFGPTAYRPVPSGTGRRAGGTESCAGANTMAPADHANAVSGKPLTHEGPSPSTHKQ